ncbi:MAG: hypothetical protein GY794_10790 [bacterium]|nr:hypothetical protein [bacterium]
MALNSNFVINRIGFTHGEPNGESVEVLHRTDSTYTASRLGLIFAESDQPDGHVAEASVPIPVITRDSESPESRPGISPDSVKVPKSFWAKLRRVFGALAVKAPAKVDLPHAKASQPPKTPPNHPATAYRKGTFKMPSELLTRLKTYAAANHKYQYTLVSESLDKYLTSEGFAPDPETDNHLR